MACRLGESLEHAVQPHDRHSHSSLQPSSRSRHCRQPTECGFTRWAPGTCSHGGCPPRSFSGWLAPGIECLALCGAPWTTASQSPPPTGGLGNHRSEQRSSPGVMSRTRRAGTPRPVRTGLEDWNCEVMSGSVGEGWRMELRQLRYFVTLAEELHADPARD